MIFWIRCAGWALFLGQWASFTRTDFRWNKIRNRSVLWSLASVAAAYALLAAGTLMGKGRYFLWDFYPVALAHMGIAWAVAVGFWLLRIWPAGDAKLFALLGVLFPIMDPLNPLLPARAVLVALMNIFIPAAFFIVLWGFHWVWKTRLLRRVEFARSLGWGRWLDKQRQGLRSIPFSEAAQSLGRAARMALSRPAESAWLAFEWLSFFAASGTLLAFLTARFGPRPWIGLALCAFSFFIWKGLAGLLGGRLLSIAAASALSVELFLRPSFPLVEAASAAFHLMVFGTAVGAGMKVMVSWAKGGRKALWGLMALPVLAGAAGPLLRLSVPLLMFGAFLGLGLAAVVINVREDTCDWEAKDLQPYLVLAPSAWDKVKEDKEFFAENFSVRYPDGLTSEQAAALRRWCARRSIPRLSTQRTLSFAFWIFGGFFLTMILKGDLLTLLAAGR